MLISSSVQNNNPLEIDTLLQEVFSHLSPEDLSRSATRVCRLWRRVADKEELWLRHCNIGGITSPLLDSWKRAYINCFSWKNLCSGTLITTKRVLPRRDKINNTSCDISGAVYRDKLAYCDIKQKKIVVENWVEDKPIFSCSFESIIEGLKYIEAYLHLDDSHLIFQRSRYKVSQFYLWNYLEAEQEPSMYEVDVQTVIIEKYNPTFLLALPGYALSFSYQDLKTDSSFLTVQTKGAYPTVLKNVLKYKEGIFICFPESVSFLFYIWSSHKQAIIHDERMKYGPASKSMIKGDYLLILESSDFFRTWSLDRMEESISFKTPELKSLYIHCIDMDLVRSLFYFANRNEVYLYNKDGVLLRIIELSIIATIKRPHFNCFGNNFVVLNQASELIIHKFTEPQEKKEACLIQ